MENFDSEQYRDNLATEIKGTPKEQRLPIVTAAQETVENWIARQEKIKKFRNEEQTDPVLTPEYLTQSLDEVPWTHNQPGSLLVEKFQQISKDTWEKLPDVIKSIIPILDAYKPYPKAVGVILCGLAEGAHYNHKIDEEVEILKTKEAVDIITAFESRLVGEEAHQISRVMELSIHKKDKVPELLPKYHDAVLGYLEAPIFAAYLARDVLYEGDVNRVNQLLDFYSMDEVKTEVVDYYKEKYAFEIGLRKLIFEKGKESDWSNYFETEFKKIDDILTKGQTLDDFAEAYTRLQNIYYVIVDNDTEGGSKNYLKFAVGAGLLEDKVAESIWNSIKNQYYLSITELNEKVSAAIDLPAILQENEDKLEKIILDKVINIPEPTTKSMRFNWDKKIYEGEYRYQNGGGGSIGVRLDNIPQSVCMQVLMEKRIDIVKELKKKHNVGV